MPTFSLPFGKGTETITLPEEHLLYDLRGRETQAVADEEAAVQAALEHPIGSAPLSKTYRPVIP